MDQVRDMLKARLADTKPSNWKIADGEDASEADGITESWIQFETAVGRGFGHLRLKDGRIWTLLTTMSTTSDNTTTIQGSTEFVRSNATRMIGHSI